MRELVKAIPTPERLPLKGKWVYDAECLPNFLSFIFKNIDTEEYVKFIIYADPYDKRRNINNLVTLIGFVNKCCDWLIGYNSTAYDDILVIFLVSNWQRLTRAEPAALTAEMYQLSQLIISSQNERRRDPTIYNLQRKKKPWKTLDLILLYNTIDRTSLKQLGIGLKHPVLEDMPFHHSHIIQHHQIPQIEYYNCNDVDITEKVLYHNSEKINHRIKFTKKFGVNLVNSCNSEIGKKLISHYYTQETGIPFEDYKNLRTTYEKVPLKYCVSPKIHFETSNYQKILNKVLATTINPNVKEKDNPFEIIVNSRYVSHSMKLGGIHSNNPPEIMDENERYCYVDIDAASFYPWIMINDNLYPQHLGPDFIKVYRKYIVEERMRVKKLDEILAYMLKIAANATFGLTNSIYSWMYDPRLTLFICISGQLYLLMLMEAIEKYSNGMIVYSNTDGLTVRVPREELSLFRSICNRWMLKTGFELEFVYYKRMIIRDVNNFIMFSHSKDPEKEMKAKGAYLYKKDEFKGYYYPIVAKAIQDYFQNGVPVEKTICECKDIYEFMASQKTNLQKFKVALFPREQFDKPEVLQRTNRWVVTNGNPLEGRLYKISKKDMKRTQIQKGYYVSIVNDVEDKPIDEYKINYDFYIMTTKAMLHLTKPRNRETHVIPTYTQSKLFAEL